MNKIYVVTYQKYPFNEDPRISQEGYSKFEDAVKFIENRKGIQDANKWVWKVEEKVYGTCALTGIYKIFEVEVK